MRLYVVVVAAVSITALTACPQCKNPATAAGQVTDRFVKVDKPIPGEYVVVLKEPDKAVAGQAVALQANSLVAKYGGATKRTFQAAIRGFSMTGTEAQAKALSSDEQVAYVQENQVIQISDTETKATWGIDRIDQRDLPLDQTYNYNASGKGVHAYIIDTGIRISHQDFGGRADVAFDAQNDGKNGIDCHGHGTHVAGTVGGTVYGVAKNVSLHAVRVLDCKGSGSTESVVAGIDWVTQNGARPAVANMSLGGPADPALDDAVRKSIAAGVVYAIAAGNDSADACLDSPARVDVAITVGATTDGDVRASFSNYGNCVDIFGPGYQITSDWNEGDLATNTISGTSMATPHVTGSAALYLEAHPTATPADVAAALVDNSTPDHVKNPGNCTSNHLLYTGFINATPPATPPSSAVQPGHTGTAVAAASVSRPVCRQ
ncbi:MAG TPA: S8 family peptidase [Myxococcaceae bacterium]|nr:S8 family peptidase [Myxococcaceae bacterium]